MPESCCDNCITIPIIIGQRTYGVLKASIIDSYKKKRIRKRSRIFALIKTTTEPVARIQAQSSPAPIRGFLLQRLLCHGAFVELKVKGQGYHFPGNGIVILFDQMSIEIQTCPTTCIYIIFFCHNFIICLFFQKDV